MRTLVIDLNKKLLRVVEPFPANLIKTAKNFKDNFTEDWNTLLEEFGETSGIPEKTFNYFTEALKKLEERGMVVSINGYDKYTLWGLSNNLFLKTKSAKVSLPKHLYKFYEREANKMVVPIEEALLYALKYYSVQKWYTNLMPEDLLKVIILNKFGVKEFTVQEIYPLLEEAEILPYIDLSLNYRFLEKTETGFKLC